MDKRVVVLGSCSVCQVFTAPNLPVKGETVIGNDYHIVVGGKGSGQAIVASRLGCEVYMLQRLGNDSYGRKQKELYEEMGMNTEFVHLDDTAPTGSGGIFVDAQGQNKIIIVPGANGKVSSQDVDGMTEVIMGAGILGAQLEIPVETVDYAIRLADRMGVRTLLDPAPVGSFPEDLYPHISIIKPNECEASELTGIPVTDETSAACAGQWFLDKGVKEAAIITLGEKGVVLVTRELQQYLPGIRVPVVDTGGAGDTFAGGLLAALSRDWPLEQAVCYAQCASALCVTRSGSYSLTRKDEVDDLFKKIYGENNSGQPVHEIYFGGRNDGERKDFPSS